MRFNVSICQFEALETDCDKLCICASDGNYTWAELQLRSQYFKQQFQSLQIPAGHPIIIYGHKQKDFVAAITACMQLRLPYIPLDTIVPSERIQKIKDITGAQVLVNLAGNDLYSDFAAIISENETKYFNSANFSKAIYHRAHDPIIYIIFTSGSTGEPKGVQITQQALDSYIDWIEKDFHFNAADVFVNQAPFSFDLSVYELMSFLHFGATLILNDNETASNQLNFIDRIKKYKGSIWVSTPSFAYKFLGVDEFVAKNISSMRTFLFCGETLPARTAKILLEKFPNSIVFNSYGPTEATVATSLVSITPSILEKYNPLPVGYPKYTSEIIIDRSENPDEKGGEIIISGEHVSIGYFKMEELNKEKFITLNNQRAFRTGDYGYFEEELLFYNGRKDEQVKLHGFRIELGDINAQLLKTEFITEAATVPLRRGSEVKKIISFVIAKTVMSRSTLILKLMQHLESSLPLYMIPSEIIILEKFPYSSNHKIDKAKLIDIYMQGQ